MKPKKCPKKKSIGNKRVRSWWREIDGCNATSKNFAFYMYVLWFNFILGLNFIFLCFNLIIIHYHTPKQRKIKFKPRIKLNHNICMPKLVM